MINLIPPNAKKSLRIEYWVRVLSVCFLIWSAALVASIGIMLPAYTVVNSQVDAYGKSVSEVSGQVADYKNVAKELVQSSLQAKLILDEKELDLFSDYVTLLEGLQSSGIELTQISLNRSNDGLSPIRVSGVASDRKTLASFRDRLLENERVEKVDLPISSLAQDKDINFSITVSIVNKTDV